MKEWGDPLFCIVGTSRQGSPPGTERNGESMATTKAKAGGAPSGGTAAVVAGMAGPVAEEFGLMLWDVRFVKEGASWILRIIIDKESEPVSINDCVDLSRRMSTLLDEADPIPQSYCLEVTSPGANRELTRPEHFDYYEGWAVTVKLYRPQDGVREFAGLLRGLENQVLTIEEEDGTLRSFDKKEVSCVHAIEDWDDGIEDDDGLDDDGNSLEI